MAQIDWIILISTLTFIVGYGVWKNNTHTTIQDYLKGGNQARWWTVGLSVMATQASAITFLSTPGQAFNDGMGFIQFYFGLPIAMVFICMFFLPVYNRLKVYTAYEFLEQRFDIRTRTLTALLFLIQRGLAAGITIYAPAIILSFVLGWNLKGLIIAIGLVVILYTLIGGTKAVNVTQKQQMFVIFFGMIVAFIFILNSLPKGVGFHEALTIAGIADKLNVVDFSIDLESRYTFWSGITGGLFLALSYFGTDQSQVQRYLSGKSLRESQIGLIMNGFLKVPMQFFILLVGVMVFVFFQFETTPLNFNPKSIIAVENTSQSEAFKILENKNQNLQASKKAILGHPNFFSDPVLQANYKKLVHEDKLQRSEAKAIIAKAAPEVETNDNDFVFISYIMKYLPQGLIGLLLAVIFSAAMSSTASELNALAATTTIDLYKRNVHGRTEKHYVSMSKLFTLIWGLFAIGFASIGNLFENLIQLVNIIGSLFYGTILGVFLVAIFIKKIKGKAIFYAALLSEGCVLLIYAQDVVGYLWLNLIGAVLTVLIALILQSIFKSKNGL